MEVEVNGIKIAYAETGKGFPLVLIHGFPLNKDIWVPQLDGLVKSAHIITPDLRGHGSSQGSSENYSMDIFVNDIAALMDTKNINGPILGGHSMGGYITMAFCRRYIRWLSGLILVSTRASADTDEGKSNRDKMASLAKEKGAESIAEAMIPKLLSPKSLTEKPELANQIKMIIEKTPIDGIVGDLMGIKNRLDSTPLLPKIPIPTLIIHGADDQLIPPSEAESMAGLIPECQLCVIPDAGHLPNLEQPDLFNDAVLNFIDSI